MQNLEWNTIKSQIKGYAKTLKGQENIHALEVFERSEDALHSMAEITSALHWIQHLPHPEFGAFFDIDSRLKDIKINRVLSVSDHLKMFHFLKGIDRLIVRFKNPLPETDLTSLKSYIDPLDSLKSVRDVLAKTYEPDKVLDSASSDLKAIRQQLVKIEKELNQKLKTIVEKHKSDLSEGFFTQRQGRYVLPVKVTVKNRFKGSVVDYSASGETVYMEPSDVGEMSAEKRRLEALEQAEIERILQSTSLLLHEHYDILVYDFKMVTTLDTIFAKADYAFAFDMVKVDFHDELNLIDARHPLIPAKDVIANTIHLAKPHQVMIISGSNTGGKTVVLKTVGVCALMAKAGLLIPVAPGSTLPFYRQIFADIGDEQSIEQSLSTFSSHLTQIITMVKDASQQDLIILDEIGSGTDPQAGASLARAIIDHFRALKADVFVTTHYPDLKAYAYDHEDILNASVAFDKETLKPTYHLFLDTPGESHAFLIAERLGLDKSIIEKAILYQADTDSPVSQLIQTLEAEKVTLEKDKMILQAQLKAVTKEKATLAEATDALAIEKRTYKDKLRQSSERELNQLKEDMAEAIENLKKSSTLKLHEIQAVKALLHSKERPHQKESNTALEVGDRVEVKKFNRPGQIKAIKKDVFIVQMGNLELNLKRDELSFLKKDSLEKPAKDKVNFQETKRIAGECDLRGLRVEEAQEQLEKYIDDCSVSKLPFARIIHGFGTLALRKMVKEMVASSPLVSHARDGQASEGGNGVTVIYFE
jgi:DNA mismatch repair protein MutS2